MKLKYFLDHPQIKRNKSVGNGNSPGSNKPGSLAEKINWGGKNTGSQPQARSKSQPKPKASGSKTASGSEGAMSSLRNWFGGKKQ